MLVDRVETAQPLPMQWLFHATKPLETGTNTFRFTGERAGLYGQFVFSASGLPSMQMIEGFPGVDPAETAGLPPQYHVRADLPAAKRHTLVTLLVPYSLKEPRRIFHFTDDQGFSADLYFTDADDNRLRIVIPKNF